MVPLLRLMVAVISNIYKREYSMVDTTDTKGSLSTSLHQKVEAGAPATEITPAMMIAAGVQAYYENTSEDWSNPGGIELCEMLKTIFLAMSATARSGRNEKATSVPHT
jgi:hypothetical protein